MSQEWIKQPGACRTWVCAGEKASRLTEGTQHDQIQASVAIGSSREEPAT